VDSEPPPSPPDEAASKTVDADRLLPGEDLGSYFADDAQHWIDVYTELLAYKNGILALTEDAVASMPRLAAAREVGETDLAVIQAERDRFHKRLSFWARRLAEIARPGP
jgi:hypothetical protein